MFAAIAASLGSHFLMRSDSELRRHVGRTDFWSATPSKA